MRLLFAHDSRFKVDEKGRLFAGGSFSDVVFKRYLDVCDELVVVGRCELIGSQDVEGYNPITLENITFIPMENTNSVLGIFKRPLIQTKIDEIVRDCNGVICRGSALGYMAAKAAKRQGKPYLIEVVGCSFDALWNHGSLIGKFYAPYAFYKARKYVRKSDYTLYVTNEFLQRRYPTNGSWIGCSDVVLTDLADNEVIESRVSRIQNRVDKEPIVLGTAGAVNVKYKGQQYVIKALAKLKQQGFTSFQYQLVGDGEQGYLRSVAHRCGVTEQVKFLGKMTHQEVFEWLDSIDVYIQPSETEGLPRALVEAMSRGLPCLGSAVGGIPELLDRDFTFSKGNVNELITLLKGLDELTLEEQAKRNFEESKKYEMNFLDSRRKEFIEKFVTSIT